MCKILFPEYQTEMNGSNLFFLLITNYINCFKFFIKNIIKKIIHFQFFSYSDFMQECIIDNKIHLIDYLYQEFLKLDYGKISKK